jgi:hypothetical protein
MTKPPKKDTGTKKAPAKKNNHLTEVLNAVTVKSPCDYNPKDVSAYILSLFLSEDKGLRKIVNEINKYHFSLPDKLIFKYYVETVPKGFRRTKFTKKTAQGKERDEQLAELMKEHGISKREAIRSLAKG